MLIKQCQVTLTGNSLKYDAEALQARLHRQELVSVTANFEKSLMYAVRYSELFGELAGVQTNWQMWNSKRSTFVDGGHLFCVIATFALIHVCPHVVAGKNLLNGVGGDLPM